MTQPQDAALLAALEQQSRQLNYALGRLELARSTCVPSPATFWRGSARHAYDAAISALTTTVELGLTALRSARDQTDWAIMQVHARG